MKSKLSTLVLILCLLIVLAACAGGLGLIQDSRVDSPLTNAAESPLAAASNSPLQASSAETFAKVDVIQLVSLDELGATFSATTGAVSGAVVVNSATIGFKPMANTKVALAEVLERPDGEIQVAGYNPSRAPFTTSDELGRFVINDVPPGKYSLILDFIIKAHLLVEPDTGDGIIVEVEPNGHVELGVIEYESLPFVGYH